ncbi:MAG TPA: hypothetical protein VKB53_11430 [Gammaproteobacteria bacterium]|nr:hypothetical protein [Gammaproteobacteria bacterium]
MEWIVVAALAVLVGGLILVVRGVSSHDIRGKLNGSHQLSCGIPWVMTPYTA